jgi:glutaredoxin-like protein
MALLTDSEAEQVRGMLEGLASDVHLTLYSQKLQCPSCPQTELIVGELDSLSDRLVVEHLNPLTETERAEADGVSDAPVIIVSDGTHNRVRFQGTPSGYEFTSLLTTIVDSGTDAAVLEPDTIRFLEERLERDLDIRVFVTTSCPHCPRAVVLAHRLAMASERIRSTAIEAGEFQALARSCMVQGVPRTIINDVYFVEGAIPESQMVEALEKALAEDEPTGARNLLEYLDVTGGNP